MSFREYMDISPEVADALKSCKAVVALESTIISHGMPYPENVKTAMAVEAVIREAGAVPATIAVLKGRLKVGLTEEEIEYLATAKNVWKVSRRDLPALIAASQDGATTVAGTMIIAAMAGIKVFVTGGVGGVHRDAGKTFDISADLEELKETDVTVVCAGCKSILDIPATLEYLETSGVPVVTYQSDEFPAFYSAKSGCKAQLRMDTPFAIAKMLKAKYALELRGGVLIACPVPENHEIPFPQMEEIIDQALKDCEAFNISGSKVTPFLLDRVVKLTEGRALAVNKELILNNAKVGAEIALELMK